MHTHTHTCVSPSIYDVLSFLGDLCPRVPLSTSSPRQLVQPLRLSAASQRPPKPATLLSLSTSQNIERRYFPNKCSILPSNSRYYIFALEENMPLPVTEIKEGNIFKQHRAISNFVESSNTQLSLPSNSRNETHSNRSILNISNDYRRNYSTNLR